NRFLTVSENHIFSPAVVSTTRLSYSRPDAHYVADYPRQLLTDPRYNFLPGEAMGVVSIGGVTDMGPSANFPRAFAGKEYTVSNDTNVSAGRSSWKFGVRVNRAEQFLQQAVCGGWSSQFRRCDDIPAGTAELYQGTVARLIQFQDVDVHDGRRLRAKRLQAL